MWTRLAHIILKNRLALILALAAITGYMGYRAKEVHMSFDYAKIVPSTDPEMIFYNSFKELFGEDGNILVIGTRDSSLYELENFNKFKYLSDQLSQLNGVNEVISLAKLHLLKKDTAEKKFDIKPIFTGSIKSKTELDSLLQVASDQKFYSGQIVNEDNGATLILVAIEKSVLDSKERLTLVKDLEMTGKAFTDATGIQLHYSGLPFVRAVIAGKVSAELNLFLILSGIVTAFILLIFFRSFSAVLFPMIVIGVIVIWVLGTLAMFNYKITLLTGLIPPIIVVIGIPNCIYLLNKYHQEYEIHGNQIKALSRVIRKIGLVTLITNFTTAIGFLVLLSTDIVILREFGTVAGINIMATFVVSIILIPAVFSYLPPPSVRHLQHLKRTPLDLVLNLLDTLVHKHRSKVYIATLIIAAISAVGLYKVQSVSFMVDDIPDKSVVKKDLRFFEKNFSGVMPLEIIVDTGRKNGVLDLKNLKKIEEFENFVADQEHISKPMSLVSFIKATRQAYYNNNPKFFDLPTRRDKNFILRYLSNGQESSDIISSFVDENGQKLRISLKIADIGSNKMDSLVRSVIEPKKEEIFGDSKMTATITGTTLIFIKGNKFLIDNLRISLLIAFVLIAIIMGVLFANVRMIMISMIPNLIPLLITAGIMGNFGIPLKPSTALIFSIAFGISVDDSIHFLAKYRQELFNNNFIVPIAITKSIRETGPSMMYTSIVLFAGFIIFVGSEFGGTVALGVLTSITLLIAMFTNLILLPALLLTFDDGKRRVDAHPLIEQYDEFYHEDDDEEIAVELLKIKKSEISSSEHKTSD